eukprot:5836488-Alexandrium_andersonii.AAC.1
MPVPYPPWLQAGAGSMGGEEGKEDGRGGRDSGGEKPCAQRHPCTDKQTAGTASTNPVCRSPTP